MHSYPFPKTSYKICLYCKHHIKFIIYNRDNLQCETRTALHDYENLLYKITNWARGYIQTRYVRSNVQGAP